jgi:hypothetical protein
VLTTRLASELREPLNEHECLQGLNIPTLKSSFQHPYDTIDPTASSLNVREIQMGWDDMEKPLSGSPLHLPTPRQTVKVSALATSRVFEPNASIVFVGTRGCGKTSLGYIAARALGRRLVEADDEFERKTGL